MLRALTSYFFGGIQDETPEAPIECETREVNDWLVVNLPDQNKDNINLNEDDDTCEIDDGDIRNEIDDEDDTIEVAASLYIDEVDDDDDEEESEEEILMSLSFLLMPPESGKLSPELSNDQYSFENQVSEHQQMMAEYFSVFTRPQWWPCDSLDNRQLLDIDRPSEQFVDLVLPVHPLPRICERDRIEGEKLYNCFVRSMVDKRRMRNEIVRDYERAQAQAIDLAPPPMYSKSYVNHRHPEKLLSNGPYSEEEHKRLLDYETAQLVRTNANLRQLRAEIRWIKRVFEDWTDETNILLRIKELEPEQQAVQRSAKKILTRGQLNRQNKNYMYETSSKKNRRSNRQRNHSGANNNRKC